MPLYIYFTVFERQVLAYIKKPHAADIIIVVMEYKNTLLKVLKIKTFAPKSALMFPPKLF